MFIELKTVKGEEIVFNTDNIVFITPDRKGSVVVDVNGMDWIVTAPYVNLRGIFQYLPKYDCKNASF